MPRIAKEEWDVVSQLAFQIQNRSIEDAGDELLSLLMEQVNEADEIEKWNLLFFAIRCLEFITASPKVLKSIVNSYIENCMIYGKRVIEEQDNNKKLTKISPISIINLLDKSHQENHKIILSSLKNIIIQKLNSTLDIEKFLTIELLKFWSIQEAIGNNIARELTNDKDIQLIYNS